MIKVMLELPPLSLYIHFPWCLKKCPYCDFNSHTLKTDLPEEAYIKALLRDLQQELSAIQNRPLVSIYLGGGTPSLFSGKSLEFLLNKIRSMVEWVSDIEITLEVNPGSLEIDRFNDYYHAGINRLSIGVQSFNDQYLAKLGRIHNAKAARKAIEAAQKAGFSNYNVDLMYALPGQTIQEGLEDLKQALALKIPHLSWYQLTIEPHTAFFHKPPILPSDDDAADLQEQGLIELETFGLNQYEIAAFSLPGFACRHNNHYWTFGDYLGIGAGAHSKITYADQQCIQRFWKVAHPKAYLSIKDMDSFRADSKALTIEELPFEFMLNVCRRYQPITRTLFEQRTGLSFDSLMPLLNKAYAKGFLNCDETAITITTLGRQFYNDLVTLFL